MLHLQQCDREGSTSTIIPTMYPNRSTADGSTAWGEPGPQIHRAAQLSKAEPEPSSRPGQSLCLVLGWRISGLWVSEKSLVSFFLCYLPEKASTQHSSAALHIPSAVWSSRRHQSCLYYQDFLKHTVPSSIGPFNHTIKRADIKFSKYPSF